MKLKSTADVVAYLEAHGELLRIHDEVDPYLEMAEIQRRIYRETGPAILFENVKGCSFPCVSNLYGTPERAKLLFKKTYGAVQAVVGAKRSDGFIETSSWCFAGGVHGSEWVAYPSSNSSRTGYAGTV